MTRAEAARPRRPSSRSWPWSRRSCSARWSSSSPTSRTCRSSARTRSARSAGRSAACSTGYGAMLAGAFGDPGADPDRDPDRRPPRDIATAIRPLTETLVAATPADPRRPGGRDLVPRRHVQHRRRRPADARRARGDAHGVRPAGPGMPSSVILVVVDPRRACSSGAFWGFIPGLPQGAHGRPRGHHDDHAQLHRRAGRVLRAAVADPAGARQHGPGLEAHVDLRRHPADPRPAGDPARLRASSSRSLMAAAVSFLLFRTTKGFELRASGFNLTAARYAGMSAGGSMMLAMALSGRPRRPGRLVHGDRHGRPAVDSTCPAGSGSPRSRWPSWPACGRAASCSRRSCSGR